MKNKVKILLENILKETAEDRPNRPKIKLRAMWQDREERRIKQYEKMFSQEVIKGDLDLMDQLPNDLNVKTKIIKGDVSFGSNIDFVPLWFKDIIIEGSFSISFCELKSMLGCPKKIYGNFWAQFNNFTNLVGSPEYVGGDYYIQVQTTEFTQEEVRKVCKVDGGIQVGKLKMIYKN